MPSLGIRLKPPSACGRPTIGWSTLPHIEGQNALVEIFTHIPNIVADPGLLDGGGGSPVWIGGASLEGGRGGARSNGIAVCGRKFKK